jgi:hypothetical protein
MQIKDAEDPSNGIIQKAETVQAKAEPPVNQYLICPVCGSTMTLLKPPCKLQCFRCGYLASCSMD